MNKTECLDYDDENLAKANFTEANELWIRQGIIEDVGLLLDGSLRNVTILRITNLVEEGSTPIPIFPIDSIRFLLLDLTNNGIERLDISDSDHRLTNLDVRKNKLTELWNVKYLKKLEYFRAGGNAVESVALNDFSGLDSLLVLSLACNRIRTISALEEISLPKLQSLDVSDNQLTSLDISMWSFPQLESFYLEDNSLTKVEGLRGKFSKKTAMAMGGRNSWDCEWFDSEMKILDKDKEFTMLFYGARPKCPDQTRRMRFICCHNSTDAKHKHQ